MSLQSGRKTRNLVTKSSLGRLLAQLGVPLVITALMFSSPFVTAVRAITLLDPEPEPSSTHFGRSFAIIGDVDADGVPDLAVGAPFQDGDFRGANGFGEPQNVGKAFLISGATLGVIARLNDPEFQMIQPRKFGGQLGSSVDAAGDINDDGIPDILVGDPHHIAEGEGGGEEAVNAGRAFVFSGANGAVLLTLDDPTPEESARFGFAVAGVGDVNSDGVKDLVIGVPGKDIGGEDGLADVGIAYVFSGSDGSLIRSLNHPSQGGAEAAARFGAAVADAGDVDNDGVSDILIGAPGHSRAFVFSGATGALIFTIKSPVAERQPSFGSAVAGGKDLNGDGIPDFAIGAPLLSSARGAAFAFNGSDGTLLYRLRSPNPQRFAKFGASIILRKDITGDGRPDILVGAPDQDVNGLINAGAVFVFRGANGNLFQSMTSAVPQAFAGYGYALATADFDGDGIPESVVGTPFENADLVDPDGDVVTHLQIGQIEIQ
jgi:hypothetical protein